MEITVSFRRRCRGRSDESAPAKLDGCRGAFLGRYREVPRENLGGQSRGICEASRVSRVSCHGSQRGLVSRTQIPSSACFEEQYMHLPWKSPQHGSYTDRHSHSFPVNYTANHNNLHSSCSLSLETWNLHLTITVLIVRATRFNCSTIYRSPPLGF